MIFTLGAQEVILPDGECETEPSEDTCTASVAGHRCRFDNGDLSHFDRTWDEETDGPWLLGIRHECGCPHGAKWPEIY